MGNDENGEFSLPSIPYFYHDIVARIIPGVIQLGLFAALTTYHLQSTEWVQRLHLKTVLDASQLAAVLMLLAAAYFIGVFFEGLVGLVRMFGLYHCAFSRALRSIRRNQETNNRNIGSENVAKLAEETSSILESYEPLVPHFFARATRFLAEAKMMLYCALSMLIAWVGVGVATGHWRPPGGGTGIIVGFLLVGLFVVVAFARQRRRAVEILRCVEYLARRTELADAQSRAVKAWKNVVPASQPESAPAAPPAL